MSEEIVSEEIVTVELDPVIWYRGKKGGALLVSIEPRQQCCIGVACTSFGIPDESIDGLGCVEELTGEAIENPRFGNVIVDVVFDDLGEVVRARDHLSDVYELNDDVVIDDDNERVRLINEALERLHASFRFAIKGEPNVTP